MDACRPKLQEMLQAAVQRVRWTYSLFWQLCPQEGVLVWGEGYYNGAIKTRKTVQPMEVSPEEASRHRSRQLRELYDSLSSGGGAGAGESSTDHQQPPRRPTAALQPEDLTETEWFYLMCVSFSFPLGVGLPGKAYARRQHMWLTGANETDSKVFSRAILAKSACIQTVVCIPLLEGVLELGTTERVQEDSGLIKLAKSFFSEELVQQVPMPALSEQSTSNPGSVDPTFFQSSPPFPTVFTALDFPSTGEADDHRGKKLQEEDEEEEEEEEEEEGEEESDSEAGTGKYSLRMKNDYPSHDDPVHLWGSSEISHVDPPPSQPVLLADQPSELMQMEMSEDIRLGSPEDYSTAALDSEIQMVDAGDAGISQAADPQQLLESYRVDPSHCWPPPQEALTADAGAGLSGCLNPMEEVLSQEDAQYFQTVSGILETNATRWAISPHSSSAAGFCCNPHQSAFSTWTNWVADPLLRPAAGDSSQRVLKYVLSTVPFLHTAKSPDDGATRPSFRKTSTTAQQDEILSANHVLAERRRREKLNERFIVLRSLVPFVTRMDKASILGDTIEYVKQLRKRIQDLESRTSRNPEALPDPRPTTGHKSPSDQPAAGNGRITTAGDNVSVMDAKRKVRVVEGKGGVAAPVNHSLQVSIIENDALLELQCPDREGLLLEVMQTMHRLRMEVTAVQSSSTNGVVVANLRAKVKEKANGKKVSIVEVKKAILQIIPLH